jgi:required for meiotic nuclear division protein 1
MDQMLASRALTARALLLGDRLDHRGLERLGPPIAGLIPLAGTGPGQAFAFRWGAIVLIGAESDAATALAAQLRPRLHEPLPEPAEEVALIRLDPMEKGPDTTGIIRLRDLSLPRQALVAELLARNALLSHQEAALARSLDRLEPVVVRLRRGRLFGSSAALLRSIGEVLAVRARVAVRVDTAASPDLLWEHPELSELHTRLAAEWELPERSEALDRKLALMRETSEAILSLIEARRSRTLELVVALLIAAQLLTAVHGLLGR